MVNKTTKILKNFTPKRTTIALSGTEPLEIPNHSRGKAPEGDQYLANKKYVDDQFPVTHASTTGRTASDHHVKYTDGEVDAIVATHTAITTAHHTKYTDAEAVSAVATADDYLVNDADDTTTGKLTMRKLKVDGEAIVITPIPAAGVTSEVITLETGNGGTSTPSVTDGGDGGAITLEAGNGGNGTYNQERGSGGDIILKPGVMGGVGNGSGTPRDGKVNVQSTLEVNSADGAIAEDAPDAVVINAGTGGNSPNSSGIAAGDGSDILFTSGDGGEGEVPIANDGSGGDLTLATGAGGTTFGGGNGGNIKLVPSIVGSGVDGIISLEGDTVFVGSGFGLPYGSFYGNEFNQSQAMTQNTTYVVTHASIADATAANLVTSDGNGKFTIVKSGRYNIQWSITAEHSATGKHILWGVAVDQALRNEGQMHRETNATSQEYQVAGNTIINMAVGEDIEICFRSVDATPGTAVVSHMNLSVVQVGG